MLPEQVGPFRILDKLGEGGMGVVYRARDPRLKRDVAVKILSPAFTGDPDRLARFEREAELLATLSHANIAAIYGVEEAHTTGTRALVMELAEGATLADRIERGPVPVDEALDIARQIAAALDYAHEHGVLHRDLKPANVKVSPDGQVKLFDFGLAKAIGPADGPSGARSTNLTNSPIQAPAMTQLGMLLGTAAYMSPEQARGRAVDRRADIWAFGCVVFEMLTGRRVFDGETVSDTLAAVLRSEPDWMRLPAATPARVRRLLRRCLARDPKERLRDIGDALEDLRQDDERGAVVHATAPRPSSWRRSRTSTARSTCSSGASISRPRRGDAFRPPKELVIPSGRPTAARSRSSRGGT